MGQRASAEEDSGGKRPGNRYSFHCLSPENEFEIRRVAGKFPQLENFPVAARNGVSKIHTAIVKYRE